MNIITIPKKKIYRQKGIVILPLKEYEKLRERIVPIFYLSGKKARDLDKLVGNGLKEYLNGKTRKIKSLADLD